MAAPAKLAAAAAGLAVAFLFVILLEVVTPPKDLETDKGDVTFERFAFAEPTRFTEGAEARVRNEGAVPVDLVLRSPDNETLRFSLDAGEMRRFVLSEEGTYTLTAVTYPWAEAGLVVLSSNPLERFFDGILG